MAAHARIRILVDHVDALAQAGLIFAFQGCPDFDVVEGRAGEIDLVATDFDRGMSWLSTLRLQSRTQVLIVTGNARECDIRRALKHGARGYILQGCSLDELTTAARDVFSGGVCLGSTVAQRLADSIHRESLTAREADVLRFVVEGLCNKAIANRLDLAIGTVKSHLRAVYAKLDVKSRTHAVAVAERRGLIEKSAPPFLGLDASMPRAGTLRATTQFHAEA